MYVECHLLADLYLMVKAGLGMDIDSETINSRNKNFRLKHTVYISIKRDSC